MQLKHDAAVLLQVRKFSVLAEDPESETLTLAGGSVMDTEISGNCFVSR